MPDTENQTTKSELEGGEAAPKNPKPEGKTKADALTKAELGEADDEDEPHVINNSHVGDLALDTLSGDVRDAMLTQFRSMQKPWAQMNQNEQTRFNDAIDQASRHLVREAVNLMTDSEFPTVRVHLGDVKIGKNGIEAKITCENTEDSRITLGEHVDSNVTIICADKTNYMAERAPARVDKDQPDLVGDKEEEIPDAPKGTKAESELEDLIEKGTAIAREAGKCSTSFLQRELSISYNRAAKVVQQLEERGIVSPAKSNGDRDILIPEDAKQSADEANAALEGAAGAEPEEDAAEGGEVSKAPPVDDVKGES